MNFKDQIERDINAVFLNQSEFAEKHNIEGKRISCMLAPDQALPVGGGYVLGVSASSVVLYAAETDLPDELEPGESLNIDGREYRVDAWDADQGMTSIKLTQIR